MKRNFPKELRYYRFRSLFFKLFIAIFFVCTVLCLVFMTMFSSTLTRSMTDNNYDLNRVYLDAVMDKADMSISSVQAIALSLSTERDLIDLGFLNSVDSKKRSDIYSLLNKAVSDSDILQDVFVYVPALDYVFESSFYSSSLSTFSGKSIIHDYYDGKTNAVQLGTNSTDRCYLFTHNTSEQATKNLL